MRVRVGGGGRGQREWGVGDVEGWKELRNFHVSLMLSLKNCTLYKFLLYNTDVMSEIYRRKNDSLLILCKNQIPRSIKLI